MYKAVFLDKDGTLIEDVPYNVDPKKIKLFPGVGPGLKRIQEQGYRIIIVSNQAGVAHGLFKEDALDGVWLDLTEKLDKYGVTVDGFYYCPHQKEGKVEGYNIDCTCRKPLPGMLEQAAKDHNLDLSQSWMIGDILNDVEAGNRAGCNTILINNGNETEWITGKYRKPDFFAASVLEATIIIDQNPDWLKPKAIIQSGLSKKIVTVG